MLDLPWCRDLAFRLQHRIAAVRELNVVTCTLFEKHVGANWLVPPHQDLMLPATGEKFRVTSDGLRLRRGVPAELERAVAVRCHLDDCGESDGALRTKPRSHTLGILLADEVSEKTCELTWQTHVACAGDILLMKPLTVHASSKSSGRSRRRVLHFVFA
jgi:ectoine hydroxylase-related dioxygenase (phytanoyl-CoA dioxygenase family)